MARVISDERIPEDRRVYYALGFLAGMRASEIAGLHWRDVDLTREPLGCVRIAVQAERDLSGAERDTKTGDVRDVPIHPAIAAILAAWKLGGYARQFARQPTDEALVVPSRQDGVSPRSKKSLERIESGLGPVCARGGLDGPAPRARRVAAEPAVVAPVEDDRHLDLDDSSDAEAAEWARLKNEASRLSDERDHAAERAMYELEERAMRARRSTAARALGWGG